MISLDYGSDMDHCGKYVSQFLAQSRTRKSFLPDYDYVNDTDYVPRRLHAANSRPEKSSSHPVPEKLVEQGDSATVNDGLDILVPNWLAWIVTIGIFVFVLAVAGWVVRPRPIFLGVATLAMATVTAGLLYGEHYLNEHIN
jgi:hypothetical protein